MLRRNGGGTSCARATDGEAMKHATAARVTNSIGNRRVEDLPATREATCGGR
jgi:hypothetical protein